MATKVLGMSALIAAVLLVACGGGTLPRSSQSPVPVQSSPAGSSSLTPAPAGTAGEQLWVRHFAGSSAPAQPGGVVASGDAARLFVTGSAGTVAYDAIAGKQLWGAPSNVFFGSGGSTPAPTAAVSPDDTKVFVSGTSGNPSDYTTFGYDAATGKQLWSERYNGPANGDDGARAIAVSPNGSTVFVTGMSKGSSGSDLATVAYDPSTGAQRWVARYPGPGEDEVGAFVAALPVPQSLAVSPDGTAVYVAGTSRASGTGLDYATIAYDAATGVQRWVSRYHDSQAGASAVTVNPRGDTVFTTGFTTGASQNGTGMDMVTVAFSASTGAQGWVSRYNGPAGGNDGGGRLVVTPAGDKLIVAGISETKPEGVDFATVGYNAATGAQLWVQRYNCVTAGVVAGLGQSPDGTRIYLTCGSRTAGTSLRDYATVAYDTSTGKQSWVMRYSGGEANALTVSRNGTVYVTGGTSSGYTTIAYHG